MMARKTPWTAPIGLVVAGALLSWAAPSAAQYETFERTNALAAEADTAMDQAIADGNAGRSAQACEGFKAARSLYIQADFNLTTTSTNANVIRATNKTSKELQSKADLAGKYARMACGR